MRSTIHQKLDTLSSLKSWNHHGLPLHRCCFKKDDELWFIPSLGLIFVCKVWGYYFIIYLEKQIKQHIKRGVNDRNWYFIPVCQKLYAMLWYLNALVWHRGSGRMAMNKSCTPNRIMISKASCMIDHASISNRTLEMQISRDAIFMRQSAKHATGIFIISGIIPLATGFLSGLQSWQCSQPSSKAATPGILWYY